MVYPEYANLDNDLDNWGQCHQVPVVFAFVMLTINWVKQRMHINRITRITLINFSQVLVGLGILGGCCAGLAACCFG